MADEAIWRELRRINRIFEQEVVSQGNLAALDRVYSPDAVILPPETEAVHGREAIRAFWRDLIGSLGLISCWLDPAEFILLGDFAHESGRGEIGGPATALRISYMVLWKRQAEGWRWHREIWTPLRDSGPGGTG